MTLAERLAQARKPAPQPDRRPEWVRRAQERRLPARVVEVTR